MKKLVFKCPQCGHNVLTEISTGQADLAPVRSINVEDGKVMEADYGDIETVYDTTTSYECANQKCGLKLPEKSLQELAESGYMIEVK